MTPGQLRKRRFEQDVSRTLASVKRLDTRILEATFRGHARKSPSRWALHCNISFACLSDGIPPFFAQRLKQVNGYFQLPQDCAPNGIWGQFEQVSVLSDSEIVHGPRPAWRMHASVTVTRHDLVDAWARVKFVFTFVALSCPIWFKADLAFRHMHIENIEDRWGQGYRRNEVLETLFCYSGRDSTYSAQVEYFRRPDGSVAPLPRLPEMAT